MSETTEALRYRNIVLEAEVERLKKENQELKNHDSAYFLGYSHGLEDKKDEFNLLKSENEKLKEDRGIFQKGFQAAKEALLKVKPLSTEGVKTVKIRFYKHDDLKGFAAYLSPSVKKDEHGIVLLDIEASLSTALEHGIPFKELLVENMMHEFGHAMEEFYDLEFSEERIEGIIDSYIKKYQEAPELSTPEPPIVEEGLNLNDLENKLDAALEKETTESLNAFINKEFLEEEECNHSCKMQKYKGRLTCELCGKEF